jgi:hypothetical protein
MREVAASSLLPPVPIKQTQAHPVSLKSQSIPVLGIAADARLSWAHSFLLE